MTRKQLFQKLGLAEGAPLPDRIARYRSHAFDAQPDEVTAMAADLEQSGDAKAATLAKKLRQFASESGGAGDDDVQTTLARKLGLDAAGTPDQLQEAFARFASGCKSKFAECMDDPAQVTTLLGDIQGVVDHEAAEHMDAYAPHFEGLKRMAEKMKRFAGEPEEPTPMAEDVAPTAMSEDPEGDAVIHNFARRRGIDVRKTPRSVILAAMAAGGGVDQAEIDQRVQAALASERLREQRRAGEQRAEQLFETAVRAGFDKDAKQGFMAMARADIAGTEKFIQSLPGAKALTRVTAGGAPIGATTGVTPQAGTRPAADDGRVNVELAERAQQLVDKAKSDPQTMSRLTKIAGKNAHPGMLLAAAQKIVSDEAPEIVEWQQPSGSPLLGLV